VDVLRDGVWHTLDDVEAATQFTRDSGSTN
jgi:hypothetical protein